MVQRNRKQTRPIVKKVKQFYLNSFGADMPVPQLNFILKKMLG